MSADSSQPVASAGPPTTADPQDPLLSSQGSVHSIVGRPAQSSDPVVKRVGLNAVFLGCLHDRHPFAVELIDRIVALVALLIAPPCPTAIFRRIWPIVVFASNGSARWSWSHVFKEIGKTLQPAHANSDAAPAVSWIILAMIRVATTLHFSPRCHSWGVGIAVLPVGSSSRGRHFFTQASATLRFTFSKIIAWHHSFCPTLTSTQRARPTSANHRPAAIDRADFRGSSVLHHNSDNITWADNINHGIAGVMT
jgi:hypothetical protein